MQLMFVSAVPGMQNDSQTAEHEVHVLQHGSVDLQGVRGAVFEMR